MALIVQDDLGTITNADSYVSVADADIYWASHGDPDDWTGADTATKEASLRYASTWLDDSFFWKSSLYTLTQNTGWPRAAYYDSEGRTIPVAVPQKVKDAACEMAVEWLVGNLGSTDLEGVASESVGASSVTYSGSGAKSFSTIKLSLREYGSSGKSSVSEIFRA